MQQIIFCKRLFVATKSKGVNDQKRSDLVILQQTSIGIFQSSQQSWYSGATPPGSGTAFFPTFSLFQHSCISNAKFFIYPDNNLAIQAQRPISAGEEITVSRVQTLEPTWKRRAKLYR